MTALKRGDWWGEKYRWAQGLRELYAGRCAEWVGEASERSLESPQK